MIGQIIIKSKCDNCTIKKFYAKNLDIHWFGEVDCPFDKCTEDMKNRKDNN